MVVWRILEFFVFLKESALSKHFIFCEFLYETSNIYRKKMWICSIFASVRKLPAVQLRTGWIFLPWPSVSPRSVKVSWMHKESQNFLFFTESGSRKQKIFGEFLTETNDFEEKSLFLSWICFFFSDQLKIKHTMSSRTVGNLKLLSVSTVWWTFWWFFCVSGVQSDI